MESVLLAVALLGFGIGGYFVVGRVARFFAIGTSGRSAGRGARSKEREDMPWLSRQWPTPPEQEKPLHNAVMHMEDEALGENTVVEVFQAGFKMGEKVIRHAMVKVAN